MTKTQITLLVVQVAISLAVSSFFVVWLLKAKQAQYKFKLYAIRDELIFLVSTGELSQESLVFKILYGTINSTIAEVHDVDRWSFIRAATRARTALQHAKMAQLFQELAEAPPDVQEVFIQFIETMASIVKANSIFTKVCILCLRTFNHGQTLINRLPRMMAKEQYDNYVYFGNLAHDYHQRVAA